MEALDRVLRRRKLEVTADPRSEMITVAVDTTHEEGEERVDLGNLGTFKNQPDGTVIFTSDNPRVKGAHVKRLQGKGGG